MEVREQAKDREREGERKRDRGRGGRLGEGREDSKQKTNTPSSGSVGSVGHRL